MVQNIENHREGKMVEKLEKIEWLARLLKSASAIALINGGVLFSGPASAQSILSDEIVVTAQKRDQNQQDVGIAITAYSGDQLRELGFTDSIDLIAQTPGVEATGYGGGILNTFVIRGVGQNDFAANQEAPVALYIDEAYQSSNVTTRFSLFDIERAEVLRGPQGTLYGRNSTGGLVHYVSVRPSEEWEGYVDFTVGEQGRRRIEAAVGGGVSEGVAFRLSFNDNRNSGLLENDIGKNAMRDNDTTVRGQLLLTPSGDLSVLLKAQYGKQGGGAAGGYSFGLPSFNPTDFFGYVDPDGDPFTISQDFNSFQDVEALDLTSIINAELGGFKLTSVTNYQDVDNSYGEDSDASPASAFNYVQSPSFKQFTQELRLNFEGERHRSVFGVFYLNIDGDYNSQQSGDIFFGTSVFTTTATQDTSTIAVFAQTEIDLSTNLALTVGGRYNRDKKDYTLESIDFGFPLYVNTLKEDDFSGKVQLDYHASDNALIYAGVSRGIKSGGFNFPLTPLAASDLPFKGEVLTAYEVGVKTNVNDLGRFNASVYYYDYNDYQAYNIDAFFNTLLFNANGEYYGAEAEFVASPIDGLDILLGASYIHTKISDLPTDFNTLDPITFLPAQNFPTGVEDAPLAPKFSVNGLMRYARPALGGMVAVQADFNWKSDHKFNLARSESTFEDSYGLLNLRLGYTSADEHWSAAVFAKNITDTRYRTFGVDGTLFFGSSEDVFGEKRWFGGNVRLAF